MPTTMAPTSGKQRDTTPPEKQLSPQEYFKYLERIQLESICLDSLTAKANRELEGGKGEATFDEKTKYKKYKGGFSIKHTGTLTVKSRNKNFVKIQTVYVLEFSTEIELPDGFFEIYMGTSLPAQVWPFVRQTFYDMTSRMCLPPLTLPLRVTPGRSIQMKY